MIGFKFSTISKNLKYYIITYIFIFNFFLFFLLFFNLDHVRPHRFHMMRLDASDDDIVYVWYFAKCVFLLNLRSSLLF